MRHKGKTMESGYCAIFSTKLRDEFLTQTSFKDTESNSANATHPDF
jgi:hypothetical protein